LVDTAKERRIDRLRTGTIVEQLNRRVSIPIDQLRRAGVAVDEALIL